MGTALSIIIPSRNEKYLEKTIKNVLENAEGEIEILVALDGWLPEPQIVTNDPRVTFFHEPESIGQRQSINKLARIAKGEYIMKLDAHCAVGPGFDRLLFEEFGDNWTVIPRMYNLDVETWTPKLHKRTDYMYMGMDDKGFLRAEYYPNAHLKQPDNDLLIDDTMACMGPCFVMKKDWFWELGGCDEAHGSWGAQSVEVSCKAWLSGGELKVNKKTWFAHWFRGGGGPGFPYPLSGNAVDRARTYSTDLWLNDKWPRAVRKFDWMIRKFNPPGWNDEAERTKLQETFYHKIHLGGHDPKWRGIKVIKLPTDFLLYSEAIWEKKPDFIIDIGTAYCGSALFFADMLELNGKGRVISIDPSPRGPLIEHPRITYLKGDSKSPEIIQQIKELVGSGSVMVSIDGDHHRQQVKWELKLYSQIVTSGQYMVVEDCYGRHGELVGPGEARDWFMRWTKNYTKTDFDKKYVVAFTKGGWLLRK